VIVWRIHRIGPSTQTVFPVGAPASGFATDVALDLPPRRSDELQVVMATTYGTTAVSFHGDQPRPGIYLDDAGRLHNQEEFPSIARGRCVE